MTPWSSGVTEDVLEIVREVATDPRSTLLHVSPEMARRGGVPEAVSARTAGWTVAERHLLRVHREEVGLLLRDLMRWEVTRKPGRLFVVRRPHEVERGRDFIEAQARDLGAKTTASSSSSPVLTERRLACVLERIASGATFPRTHWYDLAALATRIEKNVSNKMFLAAAHAEVGRTQISREILFPHTTECANSFKRAMALSLFGYASVMDRDYEAAYRANLVARGLHPYPVLHSANCLSAAFRTKNAYLVREALAAFADVEQEASAIYQYSLGITRDDKIQIVASRGSNRLIHTLDSMSPAARSIFDAVCVQQ